MKDHPHTIDRWDDSGDNLIGECAGDLQGGDRAMAERQDHAAEPSALGREKLGLNIASVTQKSAAFF